MDEGVRIVDGHPRKRNDYRRICLPSRCPQTARRRIIRAYSHVRGYNNRITLHDKRSYHARRVRVADDIPRRPLRKITDFSAAPPFTEWPGRGGCRLSNPPPPGLSRASLERNRPTVIGGKKPLSIRRIRVTSSYRLWTKREISVPDDRVDRLRDAFKTRENVKKNTIYFANRSNDESDGKTTTRGNGN